MGRVGRRRARWARLSRPGRAGLVAAALVAGAVVAGAAVDAAAGRGTPPPVVWHDQVSDGPAPAPPTR